MARVSFVTNEYGGPAFDPADDSYSAIGSFLTSDVQSVGLWCLRLIACVDDVRSGRSAAEDWSGNSFEISITPKGVHLRDLFSDDWTGDHPLEEAQSILLSYWSFLTANFGAGAADLRDWEDENGRPHPCRGSLG